MELTILMPCLNEEETLEKCIVKAMTSIRLNNLNAEILIADNGSTDKSISIAINLGARVVKVEEKGYGNTLRSGILNANGKFIIMGDSDDSYDFSNILPFILNLRNGDDLVIGNRFKGGIQKNAMPFLHRYLGNPVLSFIGRLFYQIEIKDFHCGLRGINKMSIIGLNLSTTGMEFASEMIVKSAINNMKISEVPIKLYRDGRTRAPHLNTWQDGWRHLRFLLINSPKWLFLYPGLSFLLIGLVSTFALFLGPIKIGKVNFDIGSMLYFSILVLIGFQCIFFYLFSNVLAGKLGLVENRGTNVMKFFNVKLEVGILIGALIFLTGIVLTIYSMILWNGRSWGDLNPSHIFRTLIPAVTSLVLGTQIVSNSFFLSLLKVNFKK